MDVPLADRLPGWRLRSLRLDDIERLRQVASADLQATGRELPWPAAPDGDGAEQWVTDHLAGRQGRAGALGIRDADGGLHGGVNLLAFNPAHKSVEVGVWLKSSAEGQGLITAACRVALREAVRQLGIQRALRRCEPDNLRSRTAADRLGSRYEGRQRSVHARPDGSRYPLDVLSLVGSELDSTSSTRPRRANRRARPEAV